MFLKFERRAHYDQDLKINVSSASNHIVAIIGIIASKIEVDIYKVIISVTVMIL